MTYGSTSRQRHQPQRALGSATSGQQSPEWLAEVAGRSTTDISPSTNLYGGTGRSCRRYDRGSLEDIPDDDSYIETYIARSAATHAQYLGFLSACEDLVHAVDGEATTAQPAQLGSTDTDVLMDRAKQIASHLPHELRFLSEIDHELARTLLEVDHHMQQETSYEPEVFTPSMEFLETRNAGIYRGTEATYGFNQDIYEGSVADSNMEVEKLAKFSRELAVFRMEMKKRELLLAKKAYISLQSAG